MPRSAFSARAALAAWAFLCPLAAAPAIAWQYGPATLELPEKATLAVDNGWIYVRGEGLRRFLEATGNTPTGQEFAVVGRADLAWFAVLSTAPPAREGSLEEDSTEADGRQVVVLTRYVPLRQSSLLIEILAERRDRELARQSSAALALRLRRPAPFPWMPMAAGLIAAAAIPGFLFYRRYRGL